nr:hypothetical protein [Tanacetum cinerariifolium]
MKHDDLNNNKSGNEMFVKAMTDEQMEVLRKQIAIYATICEQLVDFHKLLTSHHDLTGVRLGNLYSDPLVTSGSHKFSKRQRRVRSKRMQQVSTPNNGEFEVETEVESLKPQHNSASTVDYNMCFQNPNVM